ncbi:transcription initiation factor IIE subunit beta [Cervus canadensis]|uniref:transcription initiation factor IIE subunit beta n=1 Tax=Cervus canadensis TaxID=1574408 RepID=UPI001CA334C3|nr:transcription initiation factor IIE subunit beta [Cervus canadensis]
MDPSLLRERELFKKRALSTPVVEKRSVSSEASSSKKKKAKLEHGGSSGSKQNSGNDNPLQYSCLEDLVDGGAWRATVCGVAELDTSERLSKNIFAPKIPVALLLVGAEFQKLWRSVTVDSMDEEKIEEYLKRQGISSMQDSGPKKVAPIQRRKKPASQKKRRFKTHNEHLAGVLKDYSDIAPGK